MNDDDIRRYLITHLGEETASHIMKNAERVMKNAERVEAELVEYRRQREAQEETDRLLARCRSRS